ncbi:EutN/CcmL family microcompartment protein [Caniella muris]|uniref:EutN/CcmL family microcompartment protein n=1 Tax=Caniella muris TaxID=2941502 RepID=UPI00203CED1C|nr:EutN/CcmL family microcompartment protein [Caniella muris]
MIVCKPLGSLWATKKYGELEGLKLMRCEVVGGMDAGREIVCADTVGAGIGELVVVAQGSTAARFLGSQLGRNVPVDALIVGIVDADCDVEQGG